VSPPPEIPLTDDEDMGSGSGDFTLVEKHIDIKFSCRYMNESKTNQQVPTLQCYLLRSRYGPYMYEKIMLFYLVATCI